MGANQLPEAEYMNLTSWPTDKTVFLTLDLECDYGTALPFNKFYAARQTNLLVDLLERNSVPMTCFVQTEVLDHAATGVARLDQAAVDVEFHAHSHTHPSRPVADVEYEVNKSVSCVRKRFGTGPTGFRFPDGATRTTDYDTLADHDVDFSASLFPSWRPGRFNNVDAPQHPFQHLDSGVIELPFTVYSDKVRVPVSLSYLKLLGSPFSWFVHNRPPETVVFDMHMHDLVVPPAFSALPIWYQRIYSRQKYAGLHILEKFIRELKKTGYSFELISSLYRETENALEGWARSKGRT